MTEEIAHQFGPLSPVAGVDGCPDGWVVVADIAGRITAWIAPTISDAAHKVPAGTVLAIDIPIGLPAQHDRRCCKAARKFLGKPRSCSVFTVPVRACLVASSYEDAAALHYQADGRRISQQAWRILPKIREVDSFLHSSAASRVRVTEIHPEVSFARWGGAAMTHHKSKPSGRAEREALIDRRWPGHREPLWDRVRPGANRDDLYDAFAALWTAYRISRGAAVEMPTDPEYDATGLPMRIVS